MRKEVKGRRFLRILLYVSILSLIFFSLFIFSVFIVFLSIKYQENESNELTEYNFRNKYDQTKELSQSPNEYLSSFDNFDSEYICTGTCYCENENERRNTVVMGRKGIYFLVSAMTATLAIYQAKKYFSDECIKRMDECSDCDNCNTGTTQIKSKVEGCEKISTEEKPQEIEDDEEWRNMKFHEFQCSGHCLPRKDLEADQELSKECKDIELENIEKLSYYIREEMNEYSDEYIEEMMRFIFQHDSLVPFCKNYSPEEACVGEYKKKLNPSVDCRFIKK